MSYPHKTFRLLSHSPRRKRQQGVVIVVALFIVALVATMSYTMMSRLARDTRRTSLIVHDVQAELYADGSVIWAKDTLHNNWVKKKNDKLVDQLPIQSPVNEVNGYSITSTIRDAQGRFNINNVSKQDWQNEFIRLMRMVYPKISQEDAAGVMRATADWITPGNRDNEYARYYEGLPQPYRPAHQLMVDPGELRLVKGVTPELYAALKPYLTALPTITPINVLTAEPAVLALLSPEMTLETAKSIHDLVTANPPLNIAAFKSLDIIKNHPINDAHATLTSQNFLVETDVGIEHQHILLYTLLQRDTTGKANVIVLWQNRGSS